VRFVAEDATTTRVELEHRGLEHYGSRAGEMVGIFDSEQGWAALLAAFTAVAEG
jgi:hypothetical protein